jgi:outer membrane immunogenic protein
MTKQTLFLAASAAALAVATAASAQSAPAESWTGFHVGVGGGGDFMTAREHVKSSVIVNNNNNNGSGFGKESWSDLGKLSAFGTVEAGYDYQHSKMVVGAFANYDFGSRSVSHTDTTVMAFNNGNNGYGELTSKSSVKLGDSWALGARVGFLPTDKVLVYADAGVTGATVSQRLSFDFTSSSGSGSGSAAHNTTQTGYFVGAGMETQLSAHYTLKAEYRYSDFGTSHLMAGSVKSGDYVSDDVAVHDSSVRAVLSYHFR